MAANLWELEWHSRESQVSSVQSRLPQRAGIKQTGSIALPKAVRQECCSLEPEIFSTMSLEAGCCSSTHSSLLQGRQMLSSLQRDIFQLNIWRNLSTVSMSRDDMPAKPSTLIQHIEAHLLRSPYVLALVWGPRETQMSKAQSKNSRSSQLSGEAEQ